MRKTRYKAVPTALKSPLSWERPAEMPGLEQIKMEENIMTIEKGMIFKGNVNNVCFEILSANENIVTYRVLLGSNKISDKIHTFGRKAFEHCDLTRAA